MLLCEYGCGQEAKFQFKNGKRCCSKNIKQCPEYRKSYKHNEETKTKISRSLIGIKRSKKTKELMKKNHADFSGFNHPMFGKQHLNTTIRKIKNTKKISIEQIEGRYPFFAQIEEMRYNPDKPGEKEIQVHCKNHLCPNSKEQGGWFTPGKYKLFERIKQLEKEWGKDGCYFYCCEECKNKCPLYNLRSDPLQNIDEPYTQEEYNQFREFVLDRDNHICQYCGDPSTHVHHERPQKLEPFFALDPDLAWSCCEKCHYEKGHKKGTECSTGKLANIICV